MISGREDSTHVYNRRIFKLVVMFGSLLALTVAMYIPGNVLFIVRIVTGTDFFNSIYATGVQVLYCSGYIFHPLVQSCLRKEQQKFITTMIKKPLNYLRAMFRCLNE